MSAFNGIDRGVAGATLQWAGPARALDERALREGLRMIGAYDAIERRPMALMPAILYEIVKRVGWGAEAASWCNEHRQPKATK